MNFGREKELFMFGRGAGEHCPGARGDRSQKAVPQAGALGAAKFLGS